MERHRIFISYRRSDSSGHAGRLEADLERRLGPRLFMDVSDIAPGDEFPRVIARELQSCGAVLAIIGPGWREAFATSRSGPDYVLLELGQALAHQGITVIPVLIRGAVLPSAAELPTELQALADRQAVAIRDDRWDDDVAHLARQLRAILGLRRVSPRILAMAVVAAALIGITIRQLLPPAPAPFDRAQAHELTLAAARKAALGCGVAPGVEGECPVLLEFVPNGRVKNVYFDTGSCRYKGTGFGDCILDHLGRTRINPFNDASSVQIELGIRLDPTGAVDVFVDE
jgi:hypothetical protein